MGMQNTGSMKRSRRKKARRRRMIVRIKLATLVIIAICGINFLVKSIKHHTLDRGNTTWADVMDREQYVDKEESSITAPVLMDDDEVKSKINKLAAEDEAYKEISENYSEYPKELLASLCNNPEMLSFVQGYLDSEPEAAGGFTKEELGEEFPLFTQWDRRWGYVPYGDSCIALSGCAPTCISMVSYALTKNETVTPDKVAEYAQENGYYKPGTGTAWSLMTDGCRAFGITGREVSLDRGAVFSHLENNEPVICSMRPGDFTTQGHFIVLTAVVDGKVAVHDPNSIARSQVLWDWSLLEPQIKNLWAFS